MMPIAIRAAAVLALSLFPLHGAAQAGADTVRLRFGWTPGMQAQVEYEQVRTRDTKDGQDSVRIASTYRLETEAHPEGLLVRYADMRWTELPRMEGPEGQFFQALGRAGSRGKPHFVVNAGGEFVRVEGTEALAAELRQAMRPLMEEMEGEGMAALRNMLEATLSDEGMAAAVLAEWTTLVGFWADADLDIAGVWEMEDELQSPLSPGVAIPLVVQFDVSGRVPCTDAEAEVNDPAPRCVELQTASFPDDEAMQRAVSEFIQRAGVAEEEIAAVLSQMRVETYVTLVTEPGTLRPHLLRTIKAASGIDGDGLMQVQTDTYRFRWR